MSRKAFITPQPYVVNITVPNGSSIDTYIDAIAGENLSISKITPVLYVDGHPVNVNTTNTLDKVTVQIYHENSDETAFRGSAISVYTLEQWSKDEMEMNFVIPQSTRLKITVAHTTATWTSNVIQLELALNFTPANTSIANY
ncbi:MAG: hypothetical protein NT007_09580 [Candidatus Kapabacteria bacterium]|nr:hypothetical protein [Candidatus Kapabacteria bacterium]